MRNPRLFDRKFAPNGCFYFTTDITLRDIFAGLNHAALIGNSDNAGFEVVDLVADAIFQADALLAELAKQRGDADA